MKRPTLLPSIPDQAVGLRSFATMVASVVVMGMFGIGANLAQEPSPSTKATPLGVRQQRVHRMMEDAERRFRILAQALEATEPERAKRLIEALQKSRSLLVADRMSQLTKLLDEVRLGSATDGQQAVLEDLRKLLAILLEEKNEKDLAREEFERLIEIKKKIEQLLEEEIREAAENRRLAQKEETLKTLDGQIAAVEKALKEQTEIRNQTKEKRQTDPNSLPALSQKQIDLAEASRVIARLVREHFAGSGSNPSRAPDEKSAEGEKSPSTNEEDGKPPTGKESANDEKETSSSSAPPSPSHPAEGALQSASARQSQAGKQLQANRARAAQEQQDKAIGDLQKSLDALRGERKRIASLPKEEFKKRGEKQSEIGAETAKLAKSMKEMGSDGKGNQKQAPGQSSVEQASKSMQQAAESLSELDPDSAQPKQRRAIEEMRKALREIEQRLKQLREETQVERLARLETRFREMLAKQQKATAETDRIRLEVVADGSLKRTNRIALGAVADSERELESMAEEALEIVVDDGTSVVFPDVIRNLAADLRSTAGLLDEKRADDYVVGRQREIEETLTELIEALQQLKKQREAPPGGQGGQSGPEPLLPSSAELKLLRFAQLRINRRTELLSQVGAKDSPMMEETRTLSLRQSELADMTARILERQ